MSELTAAIDWIESRIETTATAIKSVLNIIEGKIATVQAAMTVVKNVVPSKDVAVIIADVQKVQSGEATVQTWISDVKTFYTVS